MSRSGTVRVRPDGTEVRTGTNRYEQILLGKRAARELGLPGRGWYDYTKRTAESANRTARKITNNALRAGKVEYSNGGRGENAYGRIARTAAATSRRRAIIAAGRG